MSAATWGEFKANAAAWLSDSRAVQGDAPVAVRFRLHVARGLLLADCDGIPAGLVDWTHPAAQRVQLAELEWDSLSEEERDEGQRAYLAAHGLCHIERMNCPLLRAVGHLGRARGSR